MLRITGADFMNDLKFQSKKAVEQQTIFNALQKQKLDMSDWLINEQKRRADYGKDIGKHQTKGSAINIGSNILSSLIMNSFLPGSTAISSTVTSELNPLGSIVKMLGKTLGGGWLSDTFGGDAPKQPKPAPMPELDLSALNSLMGRRLQRGPSNPLVALEEEKNRYQADIDEYSSSISDVLSKGDKSNWLTGAVMAGYPEIKRFGLNIADMLNMDFKDIWELRPQVLK